MKKFLVTILAFVYLTSTVGAMVRLDCCLEKIVAHTLGMSANDHPWDKESKGNCKDDHKQAKLGHEQKRSDAHLRFAKIVPASISTYYPENPYHAFATLKEIYPVKHTAPQQANVPLFILHCVHRI